MKQVRLVVRHDKVEAKQIDTDITEALSRNNVTTHGSNPEAVIAIGGDGTVLDAASMAMKLNVPVCGVNVGGVGYLAEFSQAEVADLADAVANDAYSTRAHSTLFVSTGDYSASAINDVVVEKVVSQHIIKVTVQINGRPLSTYRTDGVLVASPLGSTAYNLSAGGPIVDPRLDALILTPIAPHSLLSRAIVLAPDAVVTLSVTRDRPARINVDGRELCAVSPDDVVTIRRGDSSVDFLTLNRHPFPAAVRDSFGLDHA